MLEDVYLRELIKQAQQGDERSRQEIIYNSKCFIEKITSKICKRIVSWNEDEMSISLIAFDEAISKYDTSQSDNFYSYAKIIIQSRLIDYFRKEGRQQVTVSLDGVSLNAEGDEYELNPTETKQAWEYYHEQQQIKERLEEIQIYSARLQEFGICLEELEESSPSRTNARLTLIRIAHEFVKSPHLVEYLLKTKQLPLKQMTSFVPVSRKTVERGRKYLIALILILISDDLPHLRSLIAFPDLERRVQ